ncbi:MAG: 3-oxoacyl-[acyl-carrier-protein] reductase [Deltaproteobacteria bacterium]|nr:3-oxoacyl-[acyl-carrier-protein] reductase [Deltaproteobacteria bacterium]
MSQSNEVVYITGASRGIGRATAWRLAKPGTVIIINHFDPESSAAEETLAGIIERGAAGEIHYYSVADRAAVEQHFGKIVEKYGRLDLLINNAGIIRDGLALRLKEEDWDLVLAVNLKGVFICSQAAAKIMIKQRSGSIVNVSSIVGVTGNPSQANYSAAKAGVIGLTKTLAKELASRNIRVNAVAPGFIETDMTSKLPEQARQAFLTAIPLGRAGRPEDVAEGISFLASEAASYITGQVLHITGGLSM